MEKHFLLDRISKLARAAAEASLNGENREVERLVRELLSAIHSLFTTTDLQAGDFANDTASDFREWCERIHQTAAKAQAALKIDREDICLHYESQLKALFQPKEFFPREFIN
jgi:hypothetical protein